MARRFNDLTQPDRFMPFLDKLADRGTDSAGYGEAMYELGRIFGEVILSRINNSSEKVSLATTVEDADYLGKGIIETLESNGRKTWLTVFWNKRFKPNKDNNISIAPIIKEFHEKGYEQTSVLIIVKSVISNSCVVRTNLTRFIEEVKPSQIFVVAPVLFKNATNNLKSEFDPEISDLFQYLYFAEDDERTDDGIVVPGIGGDIYQRLGWGNQEAKNRSTPQIVKARR